MGYEGQKTRGKSFRMGDKMLTTAPATNQLLSARGRR